MTDLEARLQASLAGAKDRIRAAVKVAAVWCEGGDFLRVGAAIRDTSILLTALSQVREELRLACHCSCHTEDSVSSCHVCSAWGMKLHYTPPASEAAK